MSTFEIGANHGAAGEFHGPVTFHQVFGRTAPVSWPILVGMLPPLADRRLARAADEELARPDGRPTVVAGLGGVGKTQLVAGLAHQLWAAGDLDLLVWVNAACRWHWPRRSRTSSTGARGRPANATARC